MIYSGKKWPESSPEKQGIDSRKLKKALELLKKECFHDGINEVLLIRNGFKIYAGPHVKKKHNIYSCSKSYTSTALGLLIDEGLCELSTRACEIEPLLKDKYPDVTLRHFASMTSGYNAIGEPRWKDCGSDWSHTPYIPNTPMFPPGTQFCYWDDAMYMFARVLTRIAATDLKSYLDKRLFKKMRSGKWKWTIEDKIDGIPICHGGSGVITTAENIARLGYLFLKEGQWDSEQLISKQWVNTATSNQVPTALPLFASDRPISPGNGCYGFNWWLNGSVTGGSKPMPNTPLRTFYASGLMNNICFVIPEWDIVFVRLGLDGNPIREKYEVYDDFFGRLAEAMIGD